MYSAPMAWSASPALKGPAQRGVALRLQQRMEPLDIVNPELGTAMRELSEIRQGRRAEIEQVLTL